MTYSHQPTENYVDERNTKRIAGFSPKLMTKKLSEYGQCTGIDVYCMYSMCIQEIPILKTVAAMYLKIDFDGICDVNLEISA